VAELFTLIAMKTLAFVILLRCAALTAWPQQVFDSGVAIHFGDGIEEVRHLVRQEAVDDTSALARKGIDKMIVLEGLTLSFDAEHLQSIKYTRDYPYTKPPTPFAERWRNLEPIGDKRVEREMTRAEFVTYLALWEDRVKASGKTTTNWPPLLATQYTIRWLGESSVNISFGPTRKAGGPGPGVWSSGWLITFTGSPAERLQTILAHDQHYNTSAGPWINPQGGANGSQPFGSETNRTSSAAGSRR
jgi:hypothetical protein